MRSKLDAMQLVDDLMDAFTPLEAIAMLNSCISTQAERMREQQKIHEESIALISQSLQECLDEKHG